MRLVACSNCHTQYDVTDVQAETIPCRCGETIDNVPLQAKDAVIARCGSCGAGVQGNPENCQYCGSEIVQELDEHSLICPECYARSADGSRFCTACGVGFRPEQVKIEGHELPCPACSALMPPRQVGGIGVNECLSCHGLWAPGDSFDLLVGRAIEARQQASPAELHALKPRVTGSNPARQGVLYRNCPECERQMARRNYRKKSGIIIDRCTEHGTWLDADELEQIAGFILSGAAGERIQPESAEERRKKAAAAAAFARLEGERTSRVFNQTSGFSSFDSNGSAVESIAKLLFRILK
ncbi:MAG: zf-TFIIB domain-containing protein [Deltaproteobacteria bacterium]|nr:zf-TFIIB domain-containing protein [Deltaproteobacteria bacterium]MBW2540494.1 zf-TFIIB domain-containing protein [Deltaproteobacteria bacterium]